MDEIGKMLGRLGGASPAAGGASGGGAGGDLIGALGGLVGGPGGLEGLVNQLGGAGMGDAVSSWVGTGPNKSADPQQLASALGPDKVQQLAGQIGLPVNQLLPLLAGVLPMIIDKLTPDGKLPVGAAASSLDIGGLLQGLTGQGAGPASSSPLGSLGDLLGGPKG